MIWVKNGWIGPWGSLTRKREMLDSGQKVEEADPDKFDPKKEIGQSESKMNWSTLILTGQSVYCLFKCFLTADSKCQTAASIAYCLFNYYLPAKPYNRKA